MSTRHIDTSTPVRRGRKPANFHLSVIYTMNFVHYLSIECEIAYTYNTLFCIIGLFVLLYSLFVGLSPCPLVTLTNFLIFGMHNVCMYVCMYVCMHVRMYICMHVCMCICVCVCLDERMDGHT
jgi:hypothetical protein